MPGAACDVTLAVLRREPGPLFRSSLGRSTEQRAPSRHDEVALDECSSADCSQSADAAFGNLSPREN
jgi:hypothetical protein